METIFPRMLEESTGEFIGREYRMAGMNGRTSARARHASRKKGVKEEITRSYFETVFAWLVDIPGEKRRERNEIETREGEKIARNVSYRYCTAEESHVNIPRRHVTNIYSS